MNEKFLCTPFFWMAVAELVGATWVCTEAYGFRAGGGIDDPEG